MTQKKHSNRGKDPSTLTKLILCAQAGGRCQFEGCNKSLFIDGTTLTKFNKSNIAHIVASSPDGPRGNDDSYKLSDKIENLMLMCPEHHKLIDDFYEDFPVERLLKMKENSERKVDEVLNQINYPNTEIIMFESPIKNKIDAKVNFMQTVDAIYSEGYTPISNHGICVTINSSEEYRSKKFWESVEKNLDDKFAYQIESLYRISHDIQLSVFPIAPIPLIIKLGYLLGDKRKVNVYQKNRESDTWKWQSKELMNSFYTEKHISNAKGKTALMISITADIDLSRITNIDEFGTIYHLKAEKFGTNAIQSIKDLEAFWKEYISICEKIRNEDKTNEISLFPAVPVSVAFEIGRRYMVGVYPKMHIYDECDGFFETITIGGD